MLPQPDEEHLQGLGGRTLAWTTVRPQPRAQALAQQLRADVGLSSLLKHHRLQSPALPVVPRMRRWPETESLPEIETVQGLAEWLRVDLGYLLWFADLSDRNASVAASPLQHYCRHVRLKPDGALRLLESPKQHLKHVQRQILREILTLVPLHDAVHGFCTGRSSVSFAAPHAGREAVLRLDLRDFFPSVTGPRVQALFRTLGYPEHVADLLGGLCTTTTPRGFWRSMNGEVNLQSLEQARALYARPHLPQGAPSSPALANLCARRLDRRLAGLAEGAGAHYTRYADDLAFSGDHAFARAADRFAACAAAIAVEEGFSVQHRKTRLMRRSVRQHLAGLTVNVRPNLSRIDVDRLEATLVNCIRRGPETQNREGHADFRAHLAGKVAYVAMVHPAPGAALRALFGKIRWS